MDFKESPPEQDLGLGFKVGQSQRSRFINRDGTFNIHRKGILGWESFSPYHAILGMSWIYFFAWIVGLFILANIIFSFLYLLTGPNAFPGLNNIGWGSRFGILFLYSTQILTTLGASPLHPITIPANILLGLESAVGLLGFALATAIIFARVSNPATKIIFSETAVIAPYRDMTGFMFRIINGRNNELIEVSAAVTLAITDNNGQRHFKQLSLERDMVLVFPLNWTVVHPITDSSPLWGITANRLESAGAEFLITITAYDKDLSRKVYARYSYLYDEVLVGAKFVTMIHQASDGRVMADPDLISAVEKA
jgi:inward rectifier potassium channel